MRARLVTVPSSTADGALRILSATLDCSSGPIGYSELLRKSPIPNSFKPKETLEVKVSASQTELAAEAESLRAAKIIIESEINAWQDIAQIATVPELRMAALEVLASVRDHEHCHLADQTVLSAYANDTELNRDRMQWLIEKIDKQ